MWLELKKKWDVGPPCTFSNINVDFSPFCERWWKGWFFGIPEDPQTRKITKQQHRYQHNVVFQGMPASLQTQEKHVNIPGNP